MSNRGTPAGIKFDSDYGYFSEDGKEYTVKNPYTPRPWVNVVSNGDYSFIVSQMGGGYSFRGNAEQNRITRHFQDLVKDGCGKFIYIRDKQSGSFWSAAHKPVMAEYDSYTVRHGMGYSVFEHSVHGISSSMTVFVAPEDPVEFMQITLTNESGRARSLDLTSYLEWNLGMAPAEHREFHKLFIDSCFDPSLNALIVKKYISGFADAKGRHNNEDWPYTAFHASSEPVNSCDGDKESFIGLYGDERSPAAMKKDELDGNTGRFTDAAASLRVDVTLNPGERKTVVFLLGIAEAQKEDYALLIQKYASPAAAEKAFEESKDFWSNLVDREKIDTPDDGMNFMTNYWTKYQAISCRLWAKSAAYQVSAGYGFRDQLQDCQIFFVTDPKLARKQILLHAQNQFNKGDVLHWWFTIRGGGPRTNCSDDLLWLPYITDFYVKETGDNSVYNENVPFLDGGSATVYEHCKRAVELVFTRFSPRGIPLMGDHDWNDGLSAIGTDMKGESFWVAEFLYAILEDFIPLTRKMGDTALANKCSVVRQALKDNVNTFGWDGSWFLQCTTDGFEKVGSSENEEGKIFLNPQIWAVISDITDDERKNTAMKSVSEHLLKDYGALLLAPAYTKPDSDIGYITRYSPGLRENGGVYTHAAAWAVWAYAMQKDAKNAYEAYRRICPPNRSFDIERYMSEPYVTPGNIDGPISPKYGRGGWTWYSGSAQWIHKVATNWILGVRATENGLLIDPCIPAEWDGYTIKRPFRGAVYNITVKNPSHVSHGVKAVTADGKPIDGTVLPIFSNGGHAIEVLMG